MSRRQSSRFTSVAPEQQITQFLIENPLVSSILDDDAERVDKILENANIDANKHDQERQTPLHYAAFIGNPDICLSLIRNGAQIDCRESDGFTPLHRACAADRAEAVDILLQSGAQAENRNSNWETPWHIASAHGAASCLQKLVPHVQNVNIQDKLRRSALHHAAVKGHDQVTEFLLSEPCKANIAIIDKQERRPIHWAALSGHNHVVKLLLAHSAELNCFDKGRSTPLHLAAANGYSQVVEQLINHGANVNLANINADTPLHLAAKRAQTDCLNLLLKSGSKINILNKSKHSALHYSVVSGSNEKDEETTLLATTILLNAGAEIKQGKCGQTPLHWAVRRAAERQVELILRHREQSVNIYDHSGNNALHYAVRSDNAQIVTMLIEKGCDLNRENKNGLTPLHIAAQYSTKVIVTRLLQCGAMPKFDNLGRSVLHFAVIGGREDVFDVLRNIEPAMERCCNMGKTLLHYAAQGLNPKMIDLILRLTPPEVVNAKDCRGRTALHLSSSNYNYLTYRRMIPKSKFHIDENEFYQSKEKVLLEMNKKSERCCEILLQHGASAHLKDIHDFTPLHYAAGSNNNSSLSVLHKKGDSNLSLIPLLIVSSLNGCQKTISNITQIDQHAFAQKDTTQNGYDSIYYACLHGNSTVLEMLLEELASSVLSKKLSSSEVFSSGPQGRNAIHAAAMNGHQNCLQFLLNHIAVSLKIPTEKFSFGDKYGRTPLHYAALNCHEYCIEPLLELPGSSEILKIKDKNGYSVFHAAAISGASGIISMLSAHLDQEGGETTINQCLLDGDKNGRTPLQLACQFNNVDMASHLLSLCPEAINKHDIYGLTPLSHAAANGNSQVVDLILKTVTEEDIGLDDPCHARSFLSATAGCHVQIVSALKAFCKDQPELFRTWFETKNKLGQSPIHIAAKNDDVICLNTLLSIAKLIDGNFHDTLVKVDERGYNILHMVVQQKSVNVCKEFFKELLDIDKNGRLLDQAENTYGNSPLQMAILNEDEVMAEEIAKKCSPDQINHRNFKGETSLHMAGFNGMEVRTTLLAHGGDCFAFDDMGRLPLFARAITPGHLVAMYDFFEHMNKPENKSQYAQLVAEPLDESADSTRYISHLSVSGSNSTLESSNGRLSLQSSLSSLRHSTGQRHSSHNRVSSNNRFSVGRTPPNGNQDSPYKDAVFDDYESF